MPLNRDMQEHFDRVAGSYNLVRDIDQNIVDLIARVISELGSTVTLDLATGSGRYPIEIAERYGHKFVGVDQSAKMLNIARRNLTLDGYHIEFLLSDCCQLPIATSSDSQFKVVTMMNALHHIKDIPTLIESVSNIMPEDGVFLIYTRLNDQNKRTIWSQYFPNFIEHETSYLGHSAFPVEELKKEISKGGMKIIKIMQFELKRSHTLDELLYKVGARHYSTFSRYKPKELEEAIYGFKENIHQAFPETITNKDSKIDHISPMSMVFVGKSYWKNFPEPFNFLEK